MLVLGFVSFFTDISSEMVYPLIPIYLTTVLGAPVAVVGVVEGIAESTASVLRGPAGWASDRVGRHKPFIFAGSAPLRSASYSSSALSPGLSF